MRLIWLTDCHFHLSAPSLKRLFRGYVEKTATGQPDALLLGGDLCDNRNLDWLLSVFRKNIGVPIYLVLGNHEYHSSTIETVRAQASEYSRRFPKVVWLTGLSEPVRLSGDTALIGHDAWGDGRVGDLSARNLRRRTHQLRYDQILDVQRIKVGAGDDTVIIAKAILQLMHQMGEEAAEHLSRLGRNAAQWARRVIVLTHVPLFQEVTLYGKSNESDPKGLPFFCCVAAGEAVRGLAEEFPHVDFLVLSGHTHHRAEASILPNLEARVHDPIFKDIEAKWAVIDI